MASNRHAIDGGSTYVANLVFGCHLPTMGVLSVIMIIFLLLGAFEVWTGIVLLVMPVFLAFTGIQLLVLNLTLFLAKISAMCLTERGIKYMDYVHE